MKKLFFCVLFLISTIGVYAQCGSINNAFQAGEEVHYKLKFNWQFIWINVGWANMTINNYNLDGVDCFKTDLESYTNKRADSFFKMRDTLTSITTLDLEPLYFRKAAEEGSRYSVDEVNFSYRDGKCIVDQTRLHKGVTKSAHDESTNCVYDMLSILLQARSYDPTDYTPGTKILFSMATGKRVERQTLIYRRKEVYKAENGIKYRCLVFSLVEKNKKGEDEEVITFYITDDLNHIPVRLDMYLSFGSAKAFLTEIKGNRHPLACIVEDN